MFTVDIRYSIRYANQIEENVRQRLEYDIMQITEYLFSYEKSNRKEHVYIRRTNTQAKQH